MYKCNYSYMNLFNELIELNFNIALSMLFSLKGN